MNKTWSTQARLFALGLIILVLAVTAWFVREMFQPLLLAGVIAYLLFPVVEFLHTRLKLRRKLASHLVFFLSLASAIAIPSVLLPVLSSEAQTVTNDLMRTLDQVEFYLIHPLEFGQLTLHLESLVPELKQSLSGLMTPLPADAWRLIESTSRGALWLLVIVVGAYYFMTDWERVREWLIRLAPEDYRQDVRRLYLEIKQVWMAYLRGQLTLMVIVGVTFSIVWSIIGLPGALILGILGGLFSIVPDVGPFAATALALIVALLEGSTWIPVNNVIFALIVAGLYVVLINIKNVWLRPHVLGRSVHMHEGLVFIAIVAAVIFTGILGAFIVVPVLASFGVIGQYLRARILGLEPFPHYEPAVAEPTPDETRPEEKRAGARSGWFRRKKDRK
ncbi:MAG: AI-2E family transporter [Chloroflexi bacterium]|nr:AI-2E family transporter [Chloroflexota bacterium]